MDFKFDATELDILHAVLLKDHDYSELEKSTARELLKGNDPTDGKIDPHKQASALYKGWLSRRKKEKDEFAKNVNIEKSKKLDKPIYVTMTDKFMSGWGKHKIRLIN